MESIITRLYRGKVYPEEQLLPQSKEARAARSERGKWGDKLESTLSKKQLRFFEKMLDAEASCANTVRGFLIRNSGTAIDLETSSGQCHITPGMGKAILKGTVDKLQIGGREVDAEEVLGLRITSQTWGQKGALQCTMETEPLSETDFTMTM